MDKILSLLINDEGKVLKNGKHVAYQDHLGYMTIGYGKLVDSRKGGGLSEEEAIYLLKNDVTERIRLLDSNIPWWRGLNEARQAVLISMAFQLGIGGLLKFKKFLAALEAGRWKKARDAMLDSLWAKQTPKRAQRLADMVESGTM